MKKYYLLLILLVGLLSCSQEELEQQDTTSKQGDKIAKSLVKGPYDALGFGYDITGEYLHPLCVKNPVIDIEKYKKDYATRIIEGTPSWGYDHFFYGYDALDYQKDVTKEVNAEASVSVLGLKPFGGNISSNSTFKSKYHYSSKYSFASLDVTRHRRYIRINEGDATRLRNYLSADFTEDLKRYTPDKVVEMYGTHVLLNITLGGRYKLLYKAAITSETNTEYKKTKIAGGFNFMVKALKITAKADRTTETNETWYNEHREKELFVTTFGGTGSFMRYDISNDGLPMADVASWENTINNENDNLTRIDMTQTYPIYEFIADPTKKAQVKAAVEKYIANKQIEMMSLVPLLEYHNPISKDHYTTTDAFFVEKWGGGWKKSTTSGSYVLGYVFPKQEPGTIPLYEYYNAKGLDHFTTTNPSIVENYGSDWVRNSVTTGSYILGYVYPNNVAETIPLYEYVSSSESDHFTTTDAFIIQNWGGDWRKGTTNGTCILGYVFPR